MLVTQVNTTKLLDHLDKVIDSVDPALKADDVRVVGSEARALTSVQGVTHVSSDAKSLTVELGAGRYAFLITVPDED